MRQIVRAGARADQKDRCQQDGQKRRHCLAGAGDAQDGWAAIERVGKEDQNDTGQIRPEDVPEDYAVEFELDRRIGGALSVLGFALLLLAGRSPVLGKG